MYGHSFKASGLVIFVLFSKMHRNLSGFMLCIFLSPYLIQELPYLFPPTVLRSSTVS